MWTYHFTPYSGYSWLPLTVRRACQGTFRYRELNTLLNTDKNQIVSHEFDSWCRHHIRFQRRFSKSLEPPENPPCAGFFVLVCRRISGVASANKASFKGRGPFRYRRLSLRPAKLPRLPVPPVARQSPESASTSSSMGAVLTCLCNPTAARAGGSGT